MADITWEIATLDNGLRVVTAPVPTAQSVSVWTFVGVGSRGEAPRTNGLSHYLEHMMFKGSEKRPSAMAISETIEGAGGNANAFTDRDMTAYFNHMPYEKLSLAMDVLADMMQRPLIDGEEVDRERTVVQQEIRRAYDQPAAWAGRLLYKACFDDQPLGWPVAGTIETVQELRRDDFVDHIRTWYVPTNMVLSVAGNTTHPEVVAAARKLFDGLAAQESPAVEDVRDGIPPQNVVVESRDIAQSNLGIALRAISRTDPDRYAAAILNAVLGRGMSSRLFKEVRERRGLAYSVGSGVSSYNDTGVLSISSGVSPENVAETTKVIKAELMKLVEEPVGEEELTKARDYMVGTFRLSLETPMALAHHAGERLLMTGEIEPIEDVVEKLRAITADDVQRVAGRLFRNDNLSMSLVGPGADEGQLSELLAA